jgi:hypothetical protein
MKNKGHTDVLDRVQKSVPLINIETNKKQTNEKKDKGHIF